MAVDNYSSADKITIELAEAIPTGFDDDANYIPDAAGDYELKYKATDENGNESLTNLSYTITVAEIARPTITYTGTEFKDGLPYMHVEAGANTNLEDETVMQLSATDSKGVAISSPDIYLSNAHGYSFDKIGSYIVNYKVDDTYGKTSLPFEYAIDVTDTTAPTITGASSLADTVAMGTSINLTDSTTLGIILTDSFDPNPNLIIHDDGGFDKNKPGTYIISYDASDNSGNLYSSEHSGSYYSYTITVGDKTAPTLSGAIAETISAGTPIDQSYINDYVSRGIIVNDNYDLDPTVSAKFVDRTGATTIPDTSKTGDILVDYDAIDENDNHYSDPHPIGYGQQYRYTIHVVDNVAPKITGSTEEEIDFGLTSKNFDSLNARALGLTITDNVDKNPQLIIASDSDVYDGTKIGTYNMKYLAVDNDDNTSLPYEYTIIITTTPPIITTNGDLTITINSSINDDWIQYPENVEITAAGEDANFDGVPDDLTSLITVKENGGFDSTKAGTYPVTYNVEDPISGKTTSTTIDITMKEDNKPRFFGKTQSEIEEGITFDYKTSDSTGLFLSTNTVMNIEDGINDGIINVANLGTDDSASTTADNFKGDGFDSPGTYSIEYTATYNGYTATQKYTINVMTPMQPLILGKKNALYTNEDSIPYKAARDMGIMSISSKFTDITDLIENTTIVDEGGNNVLLNETGGNTPGVYTLTYKVTDPYTHIDSNPYTYTITIESLYPPIFTYTPPPVASNEMGMLNYTYDSVANTANETWQGGYNGDFVTPEKRLSAKSADNGAPIPIVLLTDGGYTKDFDKVGDYVITYQAYDVENSTFGNFTINTSVVDTIAPEFIGTIEYKVNYGWPFTKSNLALSTVDIVDGISTEWCDTITADCMTIDKTYNLNNTSIPFNGDRNDLPGKYGIDVVTQDKAGNSSTQQLIVEVRPIHEPPRFIGTMKKDIPNYIYSYFVLESYSDSNLNMDPEDVAFTDYTGSPLLTLQGKILDPATNEEEGIYLATGTTHEDDQLALGENIRTPTYCATDIDGLTTCQKIIITINRVE